MNKPKVAENLCKTCGYCVHFCPKKAIRFSDIRNKKGHFYPVVDMSICIGCGTCALVCPEAVYSMIKEG